jgi:TonB-linked SusC/RagA family outer membrane protein
MKNGLTYFMAFLCLLGLSAQAQDRLVRGKVTAATDGAPLPGVNVQVKGTNRGTTTNSEGTFSLSAAASDVLLVSSIGYTLQEVPVGSQTELTISLQENASALNEVVVTALGISREKKALGFAVQQIDGRDLTSAPDPNPLRNLAGKVAGLNVNPNAGGPGSSTRLVLRGERYVAGGDVNQPLFVIDGIPMDNSINGEANEFNGADAGDALANLNPDDIESISVLKGPNAAALYGTRAANGVVMITTKKGTAGRTSISYNTNYAADSPMYKLNFQDQYGQGEGGKYAGNSDLSWGERLGNSFTYNGTTYTAAPQDHIGAFLRTGSTWNNNLSLTAGNDLATVRFSASNVRSEGFIPNNSLNRTSLNLRATSDLSKKLTVDTKLNYIFQRVNNRPGGGEDFANPYSSVVRMPTSFPIAELENFELFTNGRPVQNFYNPNSVILGNPYWAANRLKLVENRHRLIGLAAATYRFTPKLSLLGRAGIDSYFDDSERMTYAGTPTALTNNSTSGDYSTGTNRVFELNADYLLQYNTELSSTFDLNLSTGGSLRRRSGTSAFIAAGGLDYTNLFTFNNGLRRNGGQSAPGKIEQQSLYAAAQLGFKDALFLDLTGRNDWYSTLPAANRSQFYYSATASAVLSQLLTVPDALSFLKLRASYAQAGKDASVYQTFQYLQPSAGVVGTILTNNSTRVIGDQLQPYLTTSLEFGLEARALNNRLGIDLTYYKSNTENQLFLVPLRPSSGFTSQFVNGGDIQNSGIELLLTARPVEVGTFRWDVTLNFARNRNKVIALREGLDNYGITSTRITTTSAKVGERLGELYVKGFQRHTDGRTLINPANGLPILTTGRSVYAGNVNPDWTGGLNNAFTLGNLRFEFLIDYRKGGVVASHTQAVIHGSGKALATLDGRDGSLVLPGVTATQDPTTKNWVSDGTANARAITAEAYWRFVGGRGEPVGEFFTYDATNLRLRQANLTYTVPKAAFGNGFVKGLTVGLYGRNLFFISKKAPFDPEVALNTGLGGQGLDFYGLPTTRSLGANLSVTF